MSDIYTTRSLLRVIDDFVPAPSFLLDTFFSQVMAFQTEMIDFDVITHGRTLAPFVSPLVSGKPQKSRGMATRSYKPAYVKPKTAIDPNRPLKRRPGEKYSGDLTPQVRHDAVIADTFEDHLQQIRRRKEWMAAQVMVGGSVVVEGEDFPREQVDFGRDAALTVTLAGAARWGEVGVKVLDSIETWAALMRVKGGGKASSVVFDDEAWKLARGDADFYAALDLRRQNSGNMEMGPISRDRSEARYLGNIGDFDFWVYNDEYEDAAGASQTLLAPNTVLLTAPDRIEGVQAHGAILDPRAGYQALEYYPTNWVTDDPVAEWVMTQSAPLIVPGRPNATFCAIVR